MSLHYLAKFKHHFCHFPTTAATKHTSEFIYLFLVNILQSFTILDFVTFHKVVQKNVSVVVGNVSQVLLQISCRI